MVTLVHHDSPRPQAVFVGLFDVLGFKHRMSTSSLDTVVRGYESLRRLKFRAREISVATPTRLHTESVGTTIFSDTIVLWCDDNWEAVQTLLRACAVLIASALEERWPLRGGIAYGQCVLDRNTRTFVGKPIVQAFEVEKHQEWLGAALHETVIHHHSFGSRIVQLEDVLKYQIPVKPCAAPLEYAIHWGPYATGARTILEELLRDTNNSTVKGKYEATIKYLEGGGEARSKPFAPEGEPRTAQ